MNRNLIRLIAFAFFMVTVTACSGSSAPDKDEPIGAIRQHDTRIILICRDNQGEFHEKSLHISESVTCGDKTFKMEDFARSPENSYIAFPGQKNHLKEYLQKKGDSRGVVNEPWR